MARDWEPGQKRTKTKRTNDPTSLPLPGVVRHAASEAVADGFPPTHDTGQRHMDEEAGPRPPVDAYLAAILASDEDGFVKITLGNDGKSHYLKYRWTSGQWAGRYVLAVVDRGDLAYGGYLLHSKVARVHMGALKPTLDTPPPKR